MSAETESPDLGAFPEVLTVYPPGNHTKTMIFLHGFRMKAHEMLGVFVDLSASLPNWKFVLPQAPEMQITAYHGERMHSWFDYLTDNGGAQEDTIDIFGLRGTKASLQELVVREASLLPPGQKVCLGGLSQGGCMALHLATFVELRAVVTLVACRLSVSCARPLRCPWHACVALHDEVFPAAWSEALMVGADSIRKIQDSHYLEQTEVAETIAKLMHEIKD
jgi:hypothetical protein